MLQHDYTHNDFNSVTGVKSKFAKVLQFLYKNVAPSLIPAIMLLLFEHWTYAPLTHANYAMVQHGYHNFYLGTKLDLLIPYVKPMLAFYFIAIIYFFIGPILLYTIVGKRYFYIYLLWAIWSYVIGDLAVLFFPVKDTLPGFQPIGTAAAAFGCAPSFHVMIIYMIFIMARQKPENGVRTTKHYVFMWWSLIYALSIPPTTWLVKQHYIFDSVIAIFICEAMTLIIKMIFKNKGSITLNTLFTSINMIFMAENGMPETHFKWAEAYLKYKDNKAVVILLRCLVFIFISLSLYSFTFGN